MARKTKHPHPRQASRAERLNWAPSKCGVVLVLRAEGPDRAPQPASLQRCDACHDRPVRVRSKRIIGGEVTQQCGTSFAPVSRRLRHISRHQPSAVGGEYCPDDSLNRPGAARQEQLVEARTQGYYDVQIFPAQQLGGLRDQVEQTMLGTIEVKTPETIHSRTSRSEIASIVA